MKSLTVIVSLLLSSLLFIGCNEGAGNPFTGSQWDIGIHHVSFSHAVAEWDTTNNQLLLKFDLLSGTTFPDAVVEIPEVSTLTVNDPRDVNITVLMSQDMTFESIAGDPDINATITFTRFDLSPLGAVTGTIEGMAQLTEDPMEPPVMLTASFENVIVTN